VSYFGAAFLDTSVQLGDSCLRGMPLAEIIGITGATLCTRDVALWRARADRKRVLSSTNPQGQH
jgi:hypothetical protein